MLALQVITTRDIQSLAVAAALFLCLLVLGLVFRRSIKGLLNEREWRIFFKLVGILILGLLLVFTNIAVEFPSEKFIYGRF